jgi:hypothetical protein
MQENLLPILARWAKTRKECCLRSKFLPKGEIFFIFCIAERQGDTNKKKAKNQN